MTTMMQDVIRGGTGSRALQLGRDDLAGKTGTTNDQMDAWFAGYTTGLTAIAWMGFDSPRSLGAGETGAQAALPIWIAYMGTALKDVPEQPPVAPDGVIAAAINPDTGLRDDRAPNRMMEYFFHENMPPEDEGGGNPAGGKDDIENQIY